MMNIVNSAPPDTVLVNGGVYSIHTDYRIWLEIYAKLNQIDTVGDDKETFEYNMNLICEIMLLAFGKLIDEPYADTISALREFMAGYPQEPNGYPFASEAAENEKLYSFEHDINYIILAIRNQSGIDLSFKSKEKLHWWLFLLEFQTLEEHHYICNLMSKRAYTGDDKELLKLKAKVALPITLTRSQQRQMEELDKIFAKNY